MTPLQRTLLKALPRGKSNALSTKQLAAKTDSHVNSIGVSLSYMVKDKRIHTEKREVGTYKKWYAGGGEFVTLPIINSFWWVEQ